MAPKKVVRVPDGAPLGFLRLETAADRLAAGDTAGASEIAQGILRAARSRSPVFRLIPRFAAADDHVDDDHDGRTRSQRVKEYRYCSKNRSVEDMMKMVMMMIVMLVLLMMATRQQCKTSLDTLTCICDTTTVRYEPIM
jgi:hypothetical protein